VGLPLLSLPPLLSFFVSHLFPPFSALRIFRWPASPPQNRRHQISRNTHHPLSPLSSPLTYLSLVNFFHFLRSTASNLSKCKLFQNIPNHFLSSFLGLHLASHPPPHSLCQAYFLTNDCHFFSKHVHDIFACFAFATKH